MFTLAGNAILLFFIVTNSFNIVSQDITFANENSQENEVSISITSTPTKKSQPTTLPSPTQTLDPTSTPSPTPTTVPTKEPDVPKQTNDETSSEASIKTQSGGSLLDQINNFRASKGLAHLTSEANTCSFANTRAAEIVSSFNHDGFSQRIDSGSLPYPSYTSIAENIAMNPDPAAVVPGWIASAGHNENMSKNVPYGCVGQSGQYYVLEIWAP